MSVRRATQCLGKLPDKSSRSGHSFNPASPIWPGKLSNPSSPLRWHDERETSKLIQAASPRASSADASDRLFRSRETVKAWLEASPTSVLDDHHLDGDTSAHSSLESFNSTPLGSPFHRSVTSSRFLSPCPSVTRQAGFLSPCSTTHQPGLVRVRAISPPRCPATSKSSTDVSRIDAAQGTYFISLATKNAQNRGTSTPPALGAVRDEAEECDSPRSEFSLTSEWQNMLAAGNAAGMSTRDCDSTANYSERENPYDGSDANAMFRARRAHAQVMRPEPCRIRSMELPKVSRVHDHNLPQRHSAPQQFERRRTVHYDTSDLDSMSGRISQRSRSIEEAFTQRMQHRAAVTWATKQGEVREVKRAGFLEKLQNDIAMAFRKTTEEKRAIAEAKRSEKAARAATEPRLTRRRSSKSPRGCLFLG